MELCGRYWLSRGDSCAWGLVSLLAVETQRTCTYNPKSLHAAIHVDSIGRAFLPRSTRLFRECPLPLFDLSDTNRL